MLSAIKIGHIRKVRPGATATKYANFDLEDLHGMIRCILWPDEFVTYGELVQPDAMLLVRGSIDRRGGEEANLIVNELVPLDQLDTRYTTGVVIRIDPRIHGPDVLPKVREIVRCYPGTRSLELVLSLDDGSRVHLTSERLHLEIHPELRERVENLLGPGHYQLVTAPPKPSNGNGQRWGRPAGAGRREP
ncbi:MAG: OB-fold nucleic acid binding domain-containing protein, partial [Pirellulaceae bacterium]|jgi:DNA polymerase-3 subunit alpha|nr:OB-fold nucleic acid binding domain-containing protein [Pirellulaceae bacterium]